MTIFLAINTVLVDLAALAVLFLTVKSVRQGNWVELTMTPWMKSIHDLLTLRDDPDQICQFVMPHGGTPLTAEQALALVLGQPQPQYTPPQPGGTPCTCESITGKHLTSCPRGIGQ
jgi:hypothetical protein